MEQINLDKINLEIEKTEINRKLETDLKKLDLEECEKKHKYEIEKMEKDLMHQEELAKLEIKAKKRENELKYKLEEIEIKKIMISKINNVDYSIAFKLLGIEEKKNLGQQYQQYQFQNYPPYMNQNQYAPQTNQQNYIPQPLNFNQQPIVNNNQLYPQPQPSQSSINNIPNSSINLFGNKIK